MSMRAVGNIPQGTILYQGRYRIDLLLARTPHRAIYRAWNFARNRAATIVELVASDEQHVTTALERAAPLVQLDHHTLTTFQVVFVEDDTVFIGLTIAGGQTIEHIMAERAVPIAHSAAVRWISQAAEMLEFFDNCLQGWHLGDLSQGALLVTAEDRVQLLGFEIPLGLLTPVQIASELPHGAVAPEMLQGQCDGRSDVYGLAATLHLLLTGQAWAGGEPATSTALDNVQPELPRPLVTSIRRALKIDPAERWSDVAAFHGALLSAMSTREASVPQDDWWFTAESQQPLAAEPETLITSRDDLDQAIVSESAIQSAITLMPDVPVDAPDAPVSAPAPTPDDTWVPGASVHQLITAANNPNTQEMPILAEDVTPEDEVHENGNGFYSYTPADFFTQDASLPQRDDLGTTPSTEVNTEALAVAPEVLDNLGQLPASSEPAGSLDDVQPMLDIVWTTPTEDEDWIDVIAPPVVDSPSAEEPVVVEQWIDVIPMVQPELPAVAAIAPVAFAVAPMPMLPVDNDGPLVSFIDIPVVQAVPPATQLVDDIPEPATEPTPTPPVVVLPEPEPIAEPMLTVAVADTVEEQLIVAHSTPPVVASAASAPPPTTSKTPSRPLLDRLRNILPTPNTPAVATCTIVVPRHMYPQHSYTILVRLQCRITRKLTDQPHNAPTLAMIEVDASPDAFYLPVKKMALPIPLDGGLSEASLAITAQRASPNGTDRMTFTLRLADGTILHKGRHFVADIAILTTSQIANGNQMLTLVHPLDISL